MSDKKSYGHQLLILLLLLCAISIVKGLQGIRTAEQEPRQETADERQREELFLLGTAAEVDGLQEDEVLTDRGVYESHTDLSGFLYQRMNVVLGKEMPQGHPVIEEAETGSDTAFILQNIYILEAEPEGIVVLYDNYRVPLEGRIDDGYDYKQVADVRLEDGKVTHMKLKGERIRGNILAVYDNKIEIEGYGILPMAEEFRIYEDYEIPRELTASQLVVGYDIAEFIVAEGSVCAGIVEAPPDMTNIRVAINRTGYEGLYHGKIRILPECDVIMKTEQGEEVLPAGEEIVVLPEFLFMEERISLTPTEEGAGMKVCSVERSQGNPTYLGTLEINRRKEGLLLINELGLEAYLCSVVPSEMPASYEPEALKAQAVCARSYAYNQIRESKYQAYGAHVEDSVSSQVYNNIEKQDSTTRAVYETAGEVARYGGEVITAYYFSTSCGNTATGGVWGGKEEAFPYLKAKPIQNAAGEDYESEESWYRWSTVGEGREYWKDVAGNICKMARESPDKVLVRQKDGRYVGGAAAPDIGTVVDVREGERLEGGVLHSLYIDGTKDCVRIDTEYVIRSVLCKKGMEILRQDGSVIKAGTLLPSGFFRISLEQKDGRAACIRIEGGGYGHGAGMSQNGANRMAEQGSTYREILSFFYDGISVDNIQGE